MTLHLHDNFLQWLRQRAVTPSHRQLLIISGSQAWTEDVAEHLVRLQQPSSCLLVDIESTSGFSSATPIRANQFRQALGQEFEFLIYNGFAGFRASALMALSGVVRGSGVMVLLCPDFDDWPHFTDPELAQRVSHGFTGSHIKNRFLSWLKDNIVKDERVAVLTPSTFTGRPAPISQYTETAPNPFANAAQQHAHDCIVAMMNTKSRQYLALTADRGRGKSSVLGLAARSLAGKASIIVTAPARAAVEQVFLHAGEGNAKQKNTLRYLPVDELLVREHHADMLFIDEAAAIPTSTLKALCDRFRRIVFSSTVHGYEGSGRGFEIRFKPFLYRHYPKTRFMHLSPPVRWSEGDCLETFWFNVMLMSEDTQDDEPKIESQVQCLTSRFVSQDELLRNPKLMAQVFSLLVNAHYQTSPDDLVRLLDAPDSILYTSIDSGERVLAVAHVIKEGGNRLASLTHDITAGSRRVNGHMSPQSLAVMFCDAQFVSATYRRITRIAVNEQVRRKGIGRELLGFVEQRAEDDNVDFLTTSFGASASLIEFWYRAHFHGIKLGTRRDTSSGEHSILMIKPLSTHAERLSDLYRSNVVETLVYQCPRYFKDIPAALLVAIIRTMKTTVQLTPQDEVAIKSLIKEQRTSATCELSIQRLLLASACYLPKGGSEAAALLVDRILKSCSDETLCDVYKLTGKKQIEQNVRDAVRYLSGLIDKSK